MRLVLTYALLRGAWHGLRGRTKVLKNGGLGVFAYGDGRHDDAPYMQRAINRGGAICFPPGTFLTRRTLTIRNPVAIHGAHLTTHPPRR
jgi:hypothetical protein